MRGGLFRRNHYRVGKIFGPAKKPSLDAAPTDISSQILTISDDEPDELEPELRPIFKKVTGEKQCSKSQTTSSSSTGIKLRLVMNFKEIRSLLLLCQLVCLTITRSPLMVIIKI